MTNPTLNLPKDILQMAMEWQVTLWSGEVTADEQQAFTHWLQTNPLHQLAWRHVQQIDQQLGDIPDQLANHVLRNQVLDKTTVASMDRRRLLLGLSAISTLGILGYGINHSAQWQIAIADHRTARGERRNLTLPDGTQLTLNTASAIDIKFTAEVRHIVLLRGEILVTTGIDSSAGPRPFFVETSAGIVRPIGTQFTVQERNDRDKNIAVQVTEGVVELLPKHGQGIRLQAGQQAQFNTHTTSSIQAANTANTAWTRGLLIAEQQRLGDFIANLNRYHSGILRCDPAVADLLVSGVYPLTDTHAILQALEQVLPIRVRVTLGYWTTVGSAGKK